MCPLDLFEEPGFVSYDVGPYCLCNWKIVLLPIIIVTGACFEWVDILMIIIYHHTVNCEFFLLRACHRLGRI